MSEEVPPEKREQIPPGWQEEIEECFKLLAPKVHRFLLRFTQGDHELARVLAQEVFKEASREPNWRKLRIRTDTSREAWLIRVASNLAISAFRHAETERQKWPQVCTRYKPAETDVHEKAMTDVAVEHFIKVLSEMPPQQARVAFLYWRCEWSNGEIARALGITPGRVSQHVAEAKATLRKELGPYVPFDLSDSEGGASS